MGLLGRRQVSWLVAAASVALSGLIATPAGYSQGQKKELTLVSFAVTRAAYERIIPRFVAQWKKQTGQDVVFRQSYGGSGSQTRAVIDGLDADIVALALADDTNRIQEAGLINPGWEKEVPNDGIVTRSIIAFQVRPGNPKGIKEWSDLIKPGISLVTANPKTSGGARWNFLGAWGFGLTANNNDEAKAEAFTTTLYKAAVVLPRDAREATDAFNKKGQGDVLLNYENEMLLAKLQGEKIEYVLPTVNVAIDNPIAIVDKNVDRKGNRDVAEAFLKYLYTPEAQRIYSSVGFRPVEASTVKLFADKYPVPKKMYTVADFKGWGEIRKRFFNDGGVFDKIQSGLR